jgi:hypothetical protein
MKLILFYFKIVVFFSLVVFSPHLAWPATVFSNLGQSSVGSLSIAQDSWRAEKFITGTNAAGYTLNSIQLQLATPSGTPSGLSLGIYNRIGATPGILLQALSGPSPSGSGVFTFQSGSLYLNPNEEYFVVVTASTSSSTGSFQWGLTPWTSWVGLNHLYDFYEGGFLYSSQDGQAWTYSRPNNFMFALNATVIPEPTAICLLSLSAGLAVLAHKKRRTIQQ